ncbi:sensor histidine kinase [Cellulomonas composti]|uniref:histidine kinase n=1 Tax=Cellulomonas composti TaxID=266130 RepID=A0A511J8D0_9CELL|nr:sensor histidine kinase [Cellulomonas composti]GEL94260.1 histidine kinase [Cellulomonas composti]
MSGRLGWGPAGSLRRRLFLLLGAVGVTLGVVLLVAGIVFSRLVERQELVTQDLFDATRAANVGYLSLVDAETAVRGYALTGDPQTLAPYEAALAAGVPFDDIAADLADVVDEPDLTTTAATATASAQAWFDDYATPLVAQVQEQGTGSLTPDQIAQGQALFDGVRADVEAFIAELGQVRDATADELAVLTREATALVALLGLVVIVLAGSVAVALRRWVVDPIGRLGADSRAVASGDLTHPVEAVGPSEIADLGRDIELMRTTLVEQVQAVEAARAEVEGAHSALLEQAEELRRSNRDLEQFAYVASHDLQEPLRKVASFTQLLRKRYGGQLDERADQYIDFAVDGARRMQQLIADLLGFSRVGRVGGEVTTVDLDRAFAAAVDQLSERVAESGAVVSADVLPRVRAEEPLVVQLLANLIGNALKFRSDDRAPVVHVSARRTGDEWTFTCRDNGIGIDARYAERVFVIFQRLHAKDVYEGTGIGLALCKKIVEFHGGRIWIEQPDDGIGTCLCWTLPADLPS